MKSILTFSFIFIFFQILHADWLNINSGINDQLTSIAFKGNFGLITGHKGVYVNSSGNLSTSTWTRANHSLVQNDSLVYNRSVFLSAIAAYNNTNNVIFFCGRDTVNSVGVIFRYNITSDNVELIYSAGTSFNDIERQASTTNFYVVGNNGQIVYFGESASTINTVSNSLTHDLTAIAFSGYSTTIIGSNNYVISGINTYSTPGIFTFSQSYYPQRKFKNLSYGNNSYNLYITGKNLLRNQASQITEPHLYYPDSLMGNTLLYNSNHYFVGTDNGIYSSYSTGDILELQPSSLGYNIKSIFNLSGTLIACGTNGTILYTTNNGGVNEPFVSINYNGGCLNTPQTISFTKGSVSYCSNYIDNTLINSSCNNYSYTFSTSGMHQIKISVSNSSYSKTITKNIHIVPIPQINLPTDIFDTILCKQGILDITLNNTDTNVYYSVFKFGSTTNFGNSTNSTGGTLNFQSSLINQSGYYYIQANSSLVNCFKSFTDSINILVEKPVSRLSFDIINAEVNETVHFYEHCSESDNFEWQFTNIPSTPISNLPDASISYAGIGSSTVTLIASTINGCYDTTIQRGPFIYQPPATQTSWMQKNLKTSPSTNNYNIGEDIMKTIKSKSGYLIVGNYLNRQINSRIGDSLTLNGFGGYVAKYNNDGVLKWCVHSCGINQTNFGTRIFTDISEDSEGNILFTGNNGSSGFIDNRGDTSLAYQGFLLKTDSLGNTLWNRSMNVYDAYFSNVNHDNNDNVYLTISYNSNYSPVNIATPFYLNSQTQDTIRLNEALCQTCTYLSKVIKLSPDGIKQYDFLVEISYSNAFVSPKVVFDSLNNMYLWGSKEYFGVIHDPVSGDTINLYNSPGNSGGKLYICKFDSTGSFVWKVQSFTSQASTDRTEAYALKADPSGNLFLTGRNNYYGYSSTAPQIIVNSDGTHYCSVTGKYFVAKINSNGICQWLNGNISSYYGIGFDLLLDYDTLYTVFIARNNNSPYIQQEIVGENSSAFSAYSNQYNYYIAQYDTSGVLHHVYLNGPVTNNTGNYMDITDNVNLIKLNDNYLLLSRSEKMYSSVIQVDFGFPIPPSGYQDGIQIKFHPDQGIPMTPQYVTQISDSVCSGNSYAFGNGTSNTNITSDLQYQYLDTSVNGLDSLIIYSIYIKPLITTTDSIYVCSGSNYQLGNGTTFTHVLTDFTYTESMTPTSSCLSAITHQFIVTPLPTFIDSIYVCYGSNYQLGTDTNFVNITSNFNYNDTISQFNSCDSVIVHQFIVYPVPIETDSIYVCYGSDYQMSNDTTFLNITSNFTYNDTLNQTNLCDSIARHYFVVISPDTLVNQYTICNHDTLTLNNGTVVSNIISDTVIYTIYSNYQGCDSVTQDVITLNQINMQLTVTSTNLNALATSGTFQWLDCQNNYSEIPGENSNTFIPLTSGEYAVQIVSGNCVDTSLCVLFDLNNLSISGAVNNDFIIFPNPASTVLNVELYKSSSDIAIEIFDTQGKLLLYTTHMNSENISLNISELSTGNYLIKIHTSQTVFIDTFIKE